MHDKIQHDIQQIVYGPTDIRVQAGCRILKLLCPALDSGRNRELREFGKKTFRILTRILSRHCTINSFPENINLFYQNCCKSRHDVKATEWVQHNLCEYLSLQNRRHYQFLGDRMYHRENWPASCGARGGSSI